MQYANYLAHGWPIGSGAVESANKLVVEARLKGAGMHWARAHVNPMLALRNAVCNERWGQARSQILTHLQRQKQQTRHSRREQRLAEQATARSSTEEQPCAPVVVHTVKASTPNPKLSIDTLAASTPDSPQPRRPWRPGPNHPGTRESVPC